MDVGSPRHRAAETTSLQLTATSACRGFCPVVPLLAEPASSACRSSVIVPVRNEEATLAACLTALYDQVDGDGVSLRPHMEVLLLLNNCEDRSAAVAEAWRTAHPDLAVYPIIQRLPAEIAHAGTARKLLMDTAWHRLRAKDSGSCILSTDADTVVANDWLYRTQRALAEGADAVGGVIELRECELATLPPAVRRGYRLDRRYSRLVAQLEHLLDPQAGDPWPRHLDHFGSSLACTPEAYALAGGMPAVSPLEDEAFVDRLRRAGLRLRHDPSVRVFTSARLQGRAPVGLAAQLQQWSMLPEVAAHHVLSASFLAHRFRTLRRLREVYCTGSLHHLPWVHNGWRQHGERALAEAESEPHFLGRLDCDRLIAETYAGSQMQPILEAIASLEAATGTLQPSIAVAEQTIDTALATCQS